MRKVPLYPSTRGSAQAGTLALRASKGEVRTPLPTPFSPPYRGTSLTRERIPLGPYSRHMPRALWWSYGRGAVSYERGTPVPHNGLRRDFRQTLGQKSATSSIGTPLCPYGIAYRRAWGSSKSGLSSYTKEYSVIHDSG